MIAQATRGGLAADRRDLSALSYVRRRRDPRRRPPFQVRAADPRAREPRAALGGPARRPDRHDRLGPLARASRAQAPGHRRRVPGLGRDRLAPALACRPSGPRRAGADSRSPTWRDGWLAAPPSWSGSRAARETIAPGRDADLVVFDPESSFTVDPALFITVTRRPLTKAALSWAGSRRPT